MGFPTRLLSKNWELCQWGGKLSFILRWLCWRGSASRLPLGEAAPVRTLGLMRVKPVPKDFTAVVFTLPGLPSSVSPTGCHLPPGEGFAALNDHLPHHPKSNTPAESAGVQTLFGIQQVDGTQDTESIVAGIVAVGDEDHPDLRLGNGGLAGGDFHIPGGDVV